MEGGLLSIKNSPNTFQVGRRCRKGEKCRVQVFGTLSWLRSLASAHIHFNISACTKSVSPGRELAARRRRWSRRRRLSNGHPFSLPAGFAPLPPLICGPPRRRLPRSLFEKKSVFNRSQFTMEHGEWEREREQRRRRLRQWKWQRARYTRLRTALLLVAARHSYCPTDPPPYFVLRRTVRACLTKTAGQIISGGAVTEPSALQCGGFGKSQVRSSCLWARKILSTKSSRISYHTT